MVADRIVHVARASRRADTLMRHQRVLGQVREAIVRSQPLDDLLRAVTERLGRALEIDRTSIWSFDPEGGASHCLERWDNRLGRHAADGAVPPLLIDLGLREQLARELCLMVSDVDRDPRVTTPMRDYFAAKGIRSCLYALISLPGRAIGVLAFATVTRRCNWSLEDRSLARSAADLIAYGFLLDSHREALAALDLVEDGIYVQGQRGDVIYANRAARALRSLIDDAAWHDRAGEVVWLSPEGRQREIVVNRRALPNGGRITLLSDITDRRAREREARRLEDQLRQASKMEAIGRLAGGIAHDFNNMVGGIVGFAGFLREDLEPGSSQHHFAERIVQICARAKDVVRQILAFARADQVERTEIELRAALTDSHGLLLAELPPRVELALDVGGVSLAVLFNAGQLHQLLLNLCMNASDAFESGGAGTITIRLDDIAIEHPDRRRFADAPRESGVACAFGGTLDPRRRYAAVRVIDDGGGMDQRTLDLAFEPFFTTKHRRRGTGLGLAVVHGILQSGGGAYAVRSRPGVGTEFSIYLPVEADAGAVSCAAATAPSIHGRERLLIVDDEPDLTDVLAIGFARLGYQVDVSNDPLDALARFEQDPGGWDLVIVDHLMPAMTGAALVGHLKRIRPGCPMVLCSGLNDSAAEQEARVVDADAFVAKPVEPRQLAETVRALLRPPGIGTC